MGSSNKSSSLLSEEARMRSVVEGRDVNGHDAYTERQARLPYMDHSIQLAFSSNDLTSVQKYVAIAYTYGIHISGNKRM